MNNKKKLKVLRKNLRTNSKINNSQNKKIHKAQPKMTFDIFYVLEHLDLLIDQINIQKCWFFFKYLFTINLVSDIFHYNLIKQQ